LAAGGVLKRGTAKTVPVCTWVPALASRVTDSRQLPSPGSVDIAPLSLPNSHERKSQHVCNGQRSNMTAHQVITAGCWCCRCSSGSSVMAKPLRQGSTKRTVPANEGIMLCLPLGQRILTQHEILLEAHATKLSVYLGVREAWV
jgi:hypothetical protein